MTCPSCNAATQVVESRRAEEGAAVRRRRECTGCGRRFTTYERREAEPLHVIKRGGERQRFDRGKLRTALLRAAHKRPVGRAEVEEIVRRVEAEVEGAGGELGAERIGELCMLNLRRLDLGAYLQFAGTLPTTGPEIAAADPAASARPDRDSVRPGGEDAQLPPKAASRRGPDE